MLAVAALFVLSSERPRVGKEAELPAVRLGIENLDGSLALFKGKRVGLITNATGVDRNYRRSVDILKDKVNLVALFAPEHGLRGNVVAGAPVTSGPPAAGLNTIEVLTPTWIRLSSRRNGT